VGILNEALALPPLRIEGEVRGYSLRQGKWAFFTLCDEKEEVSLGCFAFSSSITMPIEDGMRVEVTGSASIYEKTGALRLTVRRIIPQGEGTLLRAFQLLKQKLDSEGLLAPERKRVIPKLPTKIGVISSRDAAGYGDFMRIVADRYPTSFVLAHAAVQGASAVDSVITALERLNTECLPDVIVIVRGGGSLEDLAAFNDERLCRAIVRSRAPVVTGIGHERDITLADLVADVRAATPTDAAAIVLPTKQEIIERLEAAQTRTGSVIVRILSQMARRLVLLDESIRGAIARDIQRKLERLTLAEQRVVITLRSVIVQSRAKLQAKLETLEALLPTAVLERGFALLARGSEHIRSAADVKSGDTLTVTLHDGTISTRVL
jgi:exodeoxyribonuclease VII large subunit